METGKDNPEDQQIGDRTTVEPEVKDEQIEKIVEEFEYLDCVNYAMYFGCVSEEDDKTKIGHQTIQEAEKEYKDWLKQTLTTFKKEIQKEDGEQLVKGWLESKGINWYYKLKGKKYED